MTNAIKQFKPRASNAHIVWDAHSCLPLQGSDSLSVIQRHKNAGFDFVSINIGMDKQDIRQVLATLRRFIKFIQSAESGCALVGNLSELKQAKAAGLLSISFDLEGLQCVAHDPSLLSILFDLGLRQVAFAYNKDNAFCGGCLTPEIGLTDLGREAVQLSNQLGLILDCSHISPVASFEIMQLSDVPVIFSHANPLALHQHPRNISNQQIKMCAQKGGVIGVNGIGVLLGDNCSETRLWHDHFKYLVDLVGWQHVGIGLDYCYSESEMEAFAAENPEICAPYKQLNMVSPEQLNGLNNLFTLEGYSEEAIEGILGGNFLRVAAQVWKN